MSRYWKAALPFLLAAVIILAAASRPVVLHIGFPCDSYWNVPGENYYTFIDAAIEKFEAEHPNVKVEYTSGIRVEDYTEWLSGQYLLGQEPDVMVILPEDLVIFSDTASLRELDPFMKQDPEVDPGYKLRLQYIAIAHCKARHQVIAIYNSHLETVCAAAGMRAADDVHQ